MNIVVQIMATIVAAIILDVVIHYRAQQMALGAGSRTSPARYQFWSPVKLILVASYLVPLNILLNRHDSSPGTVAYITLIFFVIYLAYAAIISFRLVRQLKDSEENTR